MAANPKAAELNTLAHYTNIFSAIFTVGILISGIVLMSVYFTA